MPLAGKRIFVADDNVAYSIIARMLLERNGATTSIERWGTDTISRIQDFAPVDLILLDLMFPGGVSGFDLLGKIRAEADLAGVPVIAVSAMNPSVAIPRAQEVGFNGFILKPLETALFIDQVVQVLNGKPVWFAGLPNFTSYAPQPKQSQD